MCLPRYSMLVLPLLLIAGCSTGSISNGMFYHQSESMSVESNPAGADVYAMGEKVGVTPAKLDPSIVFPPVYDKKKEALYGKIVLRKSGCADSVLAVTTKSISEGLNARLDCGEKKPAVPEVTAPNVTAPALSGSVEQRLKRVKDMREQGLISEDEARALRARILNDF